MQPLFLLASLTLLLLILPSGNAQRRVGIVLGTGGTGGVYFYYGTTLADLLNRAGVAEVQAVSTQGSYDNLLLLRDRTNPGSNTYFCALTTVDSAYVAFLGEDPRFKDKPAKSQRVLFYMYPSFIHVVTTEKKGITVLQHLKNRRVSTGPPGSSSENLALLLLSAVGISPKDFAKHERLPIAEGAKALAEGTLDALINVSGVPTGAIVELSQTLARKGDRIRFIPLDPKSTASQILDKRFPGLVTPFKLSKEHYGTVGDTPGLAVGNIVVCPDSLPTEVAYAFVKQVFDNLAFLQSSVAAARDTSLESTVGLYGKLPIPFHPGAERYLRERGLIR
ncbi:MAG: TAXI family TRAP transporter solute-binding subunit [Thermus sp.]|uniref:TAXI family TRAP transporter solute-binding subunit n=1 Tax=Thermus sp. TaxID=275 RepID=UPI0025FEBFB3|nr:TAXI family TRAP transporter solute-binding subunit [Thermus sp.]MCS6868834.1 TAXI family TRAP transporter solute-binding subunit [Thermus sp.]MCS7218387.1 TAXI family TRAP transporter solute-binding subunit [Thermus sp.]